MEPDLETPIPPDCEIFDMAEPVDVNEVVKTAQAATFALMGNTYLNLQDFQSRMFLQMASEPGIVEAAAAKELGKMGVGTDLAGINAGSQAPRPTLGG